MGLYNNNKSIFWYESIRSFRICIYLCSLMYESDDMCRKKLDTPLVYVSRFYGTVQIKINFWKFFLELQVFHDFMAKLFEDQIVNHFHSLNVNKTMLTSRYKEAVQMLKKIRWYFFFVCQCVGHQFLPVFYWILRLE